MNFNSFFVLVIVSVTSSLTPRPAIGSGTAFVNDDSNIVVTTDFSVFGLELNSKGGYLIPIPPGDLTADADPFLGFLSNSPNQISYTSFQFRPVEQEVLSARYDPPEGILPSQDLTVACAAAVTPCNISVLDLPEPSGVRLSLWGFLLLLAARSG